MNSEGVFCYLFIEAMRDILRPVKELRLMMLCVGGEKNVFVTFVACELL